MWRTLTWCQRLNEHKNLIVRLKNQKQMWKRAWFGLQMSVFPLNSFLSFHKKCKQLISSHILINCQVVPPKYEAHKGGSRVTERSLQREEDGSDCWVDPGFSLQHIFFCKSRIQSFNYKDMLDFVHTSESICTSLSALCEVTVHNQNLWTPGSAVRNTESYPS